MKKYLSGLKKISVQAKLDEREFVSNFIDQLLEKAPCDQKLLEYIYISADDMDKNLHGIYCMLLEKNASVEWYKVCNFIYEEKDSSEIEQYYSVILKCIEEAIDADNVLEAVSETKSFEEFSKEIDNLLCANLAQSTPEEKEAPDRTQDIKEPEESFLLFLKKENQTLNEHIDGLMKELRLSREESRKAMDESYSQRKKLLEYKLEMERLSKINGTSTVSQKLLEGKAARIEKMAKQLEKNNEIILKEKRAYEEENRSLASAVEELKKEKFELEIQLRERTEQLNRLEKELSSSHFLQKEPEPIIPSYTPAFAEEEHDIEVPEMDFGDEYFEPEEIDYDEADVIEIKDNKQEITKHVNLFTFIYSKFQERKFQKKTKAEQESLIFLKAMEHNMSKTKVQHIKDAVKSGKGFSMLELYKLVSRDAPDDEIMHFLGTT